MWVIIFAAIGSLGGMVTVTQACRLTIRAIFRLAHSTEDNTRALDHLASKVDGLDAKLDLHAERIAALEGRRAAR